MGTALTLASLVALFLVFQMLYAVPWARSSISPPTLVCVHRASTQASLAALWSALATLYATFLAKFLTSRRILVSAGSGSRLILWTVSPAFRPQSAMLLVKFLTQLAMPVFVLLVSIATSILSLEHCLVSRTSFAMLSAKYSILQTTPVSALPALTATPIPSLAFSPAYPTSLPRIKSTEKTSVGRIH